jgi:hypothetical protein
MYYHLKLYYKNFRTAAMFVCRHPKDISYASIRSSKLIRIHRRLVAGLLLQKPGFHLETDRTG